MTEDDFGDADRLLSALTLDGGSHGDLPAALDLRHVEDLERAAETRGHRDGRREPDAVQPVVDAHAPLARDDLVRHRRDEREREVAMADRRAKRPILRPLGINVDPLVVTRRLCKEVDLLLRDVDPARWPEGVAGLHRHVRAGLSAAQRGAVTPIPRRAL